MREAGFGLTMLWGARAAYDAVKASTSSDTLAHVGQIAAGLAGAFVTQPFDTMATKRQHLDGKISSIDTAKKIYSEAGIGGFFKGLRHRSVLFTACAVTIPYVEEQIRHTLSNKN